MARDRTAYVFLTLMAVFFGGTWPAAKLAVLGFPPALVAAARFLIASALLWLWARRKATAEDVPLRARDLPLLLLMGGTAVAGYNVLFLYGVSLAPASDGAIIVPGLAPVLTAALAWPLLGERLARRGIAGMGLALAGLLMVVSPGESATGASTRLLGDLLFLGGAALWAIYSIVGKAATARFSPVRATLYATVTGTALLLPLAAAERGWTHVTAAPLSAWIGLMYLAIFGTVLAFVFFYEGVSRIGAPRATSFAFLVPVLGVLSSWAVLGEQLRPLALAGGMLVLAGLWLVQTGRGERASDGDRIRGETVIEQG